MLLFIDFSMFIISTYSHIRVQRAYKYSRHDTMEHLQKMYICFSQLSLNVLALSRLQRTCTLDKKQMHVPPIWLSTSNRQRRHELAKQLVATMLAVFLFDSGGAHHCLAS